MIGTFVKKQLLLFARNRHELLVLLGMPFVLITILGFALGNIMDGDHAAIHAKIAFVNEGDEQKELQAFTREIETINIPKEKKQMLIEAAHSIAPITVLKQGVFGDKSVKKYIRIIDVPPAQLEKVRQKDSYAAIIRVPSGFTYKMLQYMLLQKDEHPRLFFYTNEEKAWTAEMVGQILSAFQRHYSLAATLGKAGLADRSSSIVDVHVNGKMETVRKKEPIRAMTYYTVGMSVMFALYIASNVGSYAFEEKLSHVFDRMLLANVSRWSYMAGIFLSATLLACLQLFILYGLTSILYDITWADIPAFFIVTLSLALTVGGLAVLLTALNFRINSEQASRFFQTILVTMFSLVGGSYFPAGQLSDFISTLGTLTPNGASMNAYLKLLQGYHFNDIAHSVIYLSLFSITTLLLSIWAFPKRGNES
ncbi:ABC transporter permease [Anoxybacteroides amylolyticum]|uniref:ABC-2 type transporter family protein n=1 Tax=Anoxybacteroides amylolyticum TaxID=294699 RepID=A0A160F3I6_9BACL|nr:ABC transporter permease [Anoxybacillus amylolyticus]ANB60392.1 ABC-2 type transporter family protein [Anoxybacillus amylolyticus]